MLRMSCPHSMNDCTQWCQVAAAHTAALPSENRGRLTQAPKRDAEASCDVCLTQRCEHKLQERVAHVPASLSDNVCVRLSSQSSAHNTEENCNEHGPSQLAGMINVTLVWSQCSECGELRVVREWLVIRCKGMSLRNREYVQGESATKSYV